MLTPPVQVRGSFWISDVNGRKTLSNPKFVTYVTETVSHTAELFHVEMYGLFLYNRKISKMLQKRTASQ